MTVGQRYPAGGGRPSRFSPAGHRGAPGGSRGASGGQRPSKGSPRTSRGKGSEQRRSQQYREAVSKGLKKVQKGVSTGTDWAWEKLSQIHLPGHGEDPEGREVESEGESAPGAPSGRGAMSLERPGRGTMSLDRPGRSRPASSSGHFSERPYRPPPPAHQRSHSASDRGHRSRTPPRRPVPDEVRGQRFFRGGGVP